MMPKISIIVPVFNAEKYLERCLDSILKSLKGISGEILAVDNGSTDGSLSILEKYERKFPKLMRVLHCNTHGAGAARNYGVSKARGEYFWFIDADDEIAEGAVEKLMKEASKIKADLVMLGMKKIFPDGREVVLSAVDPSSRDYKSRFVRYGMGPTQFLIKRGWWVENGFSFRETGMHEDVELMSSLILYTDKYACVNEVLYYYYQNKGSVIHKEKWDKGYLDIFRALRGYYQRFLDLGVLEEFHDEVEWYFIWNLLIDSAKDFAKFPEGKPGFSRSREMLKKYFPKWRKNRFLKEKPLRLKVRVRLNYYK